MTTRRHPSRKDKHEPGGPIDTSDHGDGTGEDAKLLAGTDSAEQPMTDVDR